MIRYLFASILILAAIALYYTVDMPVLNLDLTQKTRNDLFKLGQDTEVDHSIYILNIGQLDPDEVRSKIDSLLILKPRIVGVNLCHFDAVPHDFIEHYASNDHVIVADCRDGNKNSQSRIVDEGNIVTHFRTDKPDYFELRLTGFKGRDNDKELINYTISGDLPFTYKAELAGSDWWQNGEFLEGKTVLVGYVGDYFTGAVDYYYTNSRVTPLNNSYGQPRTLPDMYDIDISAAIIHMIHDKAFINEVSLSLRVVILLIFTLLNAVILMYISTRWLIVNVLIAIIAFFILNLIGANCIVLMFERNYYLNLDELPVLLLITAIFTVTLNIFEEHRKASKAIGN